MSLLDNLNAFRNKVKTAPVLPTKTAKSASPPTPTTTTATATTATTSSSASTTNKRRFEDDDDNDDFFSSNNDDNLNDTFKRQQLHSEDSTSTHLSTQLHLAVTYIKEKDHEIPLRDMFSYLNVNNEGERTKLMNLLVKLPKIRYEAESQTVEYVSIHNIKTKDQLLTFLRAQKTFKGTPYKELRDGWSTCLEAVNELEAEGKIVVQRTKKDGTPRFVWSNDGGELGAVEEEFVKVWQSVKLPERSELPGMLSKLGLKPASVDPATIKAENNGQDLKKRKQRKGKITNTHMAGILKDYS